MSQIGSFALLLALGLSAYSFLAGFVALFGKDAASARLGETARRAGIATFAAVLLAAIVLVMARSTTTSPSPTFASTATAICRSRTSSPCSGRGRRARCFSGPCY